ncbi:cyclic nucleotide-binding domain-containing protein [Chloroflexota bacterium]
MMISPEILRRYPLFADLEDQFLKEIAMIGDEVVLADGVWLFEEGDAADDWYVITRGTVELKAQLPGGQYADLDELVEGDLVGWSAICNPVNFTLGAVTPTGARLLKLEGAAMQDLMQKNPEMGFHIMCHINQVIGTRLTNLRTRFVSMV